MTTALTKVMGLGQVDHFSASTKCVCGPCLPILASLLLPYTQAKTSSILVLKGWEIPWLSAG